jgi:hypothetical protein
MRFINIYPVSFGHPSKLFGNKGLGAGQTTQGILPRAVIDLNGGTNN